MPFESPFKSWTPPTPFGQGEDSSEIAKGFKENIDTTQGSIIGAIGMMADSLGLDQTKKLLFDSAQRQFAESEQYQTKVPFSEMETGKDLKEWVLHTLGGAIPTALTGMGAGLVGKKVAGSMVKDKLKGVVGTKIGEEISKKAASRGVKAGVFSAFYPIESGQMWIEDAQKHGIDETQPLKSAVTGIAVAGLEILGGSQRLIDATLGTSAAKTFALAAKSKKKDVAKRIMGKALNLANEEGLQELGQGILSSLNAQWTSTPEENYELFSRENVTNWMESYFAGGTVGLVMSVPTQILTRNQSPEATQKIQAIKGEEITQPEQVAPTQTQQSVPIEEMANIPQQEGQIGETPLPGDVGIPQAPIAQQPVQETVQPIPETVADITQVTQPGIVEPVVPSRPIDRSVQPAMDTFQRSRALNPPVSQVQDRSVKPATDFSKPVVKEVAQPDVFDLKKSLETPLTPKTEIPKPAEIPSKEEIRVERDKENAAALKELAKKDYDPELQEYVPIKPFPFKKNETVQYKTKDGIKKTGKITNVNETSQNVIIDGKTYPTGGILKLDEATERKTEGVKEGVKQPHEMTRSEFVGELPSMKEGLTPKQSMKRAKDVKAFIAKSEQHEFAVRKAVFDNKPVPSKVLDDYPKINIDNWKPNVKQEATKTEQKNDRNNYTLERYDNKTDSIQNETFSRGDYVEARFGKGKSTKGKISGISHNKKQAKVNGVWHDFGTVYKAVEPKKIATPKTKLSKVANQASQKPDGGFTEADRVPAQSIPAKKPQTPKQKLIKQAEYKEINIGDKNYRVKLLTGNVDDIKNTLRFFDVRKAPYDSAIRRPETIQKVKSEYLKQHYPEIYSKIEKEKQTVSYKAIQESQKTPKEKLKSAAKKAKSKPQLSVKKAAQPQITEQTIKDTFKGQEVTQDKKDPKKYWVKTKGNLGFSVSTVKEISPGKYNLSLQSGETIAGKYQDRTIELSEGVADKETLDHEVVHMLEDTGLLTVKDKLIIDQKIAQEVKKGTFTEGKDRAESRAEFIARNLKNRNNKTGFGKVMQKIADFIDKLINLAKTTTRGIERKIESGKIFDKKVTKSVQKKPQYSITKPSEKFKKESDLLWPLMQSTKDIFTNWKEWGTLGKFFKTMEFAKDKVGKLIFEATQVREQRKHSLFNDLNTLGGTIPDGIGKALQQMKYKGADKFRKIKGFDIYGRKDFDKLPKEYKQIWEAINHMDENNANWEDTKDDKGLTVPGYKRVLQKKGVAGDVIGSIEAMRKSYDQSLEYMRKSIDELIKESPDAGKIVVQEFKKHKDGTITPKVTLSQAYKQMGDLRGFYAPRIRVGSQFVTAKKGGKFYRYHVEGATDLIAKTKGYKLVKELKEEGYTDVTNPQQIDKLPEEVYGGLNIADTAKAIDHSVKELKNIDPKLLTQFRLDVIQSAANMIKARGYRSHRIGRQKQVVKGYIEDPQARFLLYQNQVAGGVSKGEAAKTMTEELLKLDPAKNPESYGVYKDYIAEQLRNPDQYDRLIALGKSMITFKYLGFNLKSAFVNTTAMITTVPPALQEYATNGKASFASIGSAIKKASTDYAKYEFGKTDNNANLTKDELAFLEENKKEGYDLPQLTRETMGDLQGAYGKTWNSVMTLAMKPFAYTEQWNRGSTMLAGYRLAKKEGQSNSEAKESARKATNRAHGIYGKATLPIFAQGSNPAAKIAQMGYTYQKFAHNYLQMLNELGPWNKKNYKALSFALAAPLVVGGVSSSVLASVLSGTVTAMMRATGDDRDIEKMVFDTIRENIGETAEQTARYGVFGAMGADLSGSLGIGTEFPTTIKDLTGPFGGIADDTSRLFRYISTGQNVKALETVLPTAFASPVKALREKTEGATTGRGQRIWDKQGKPYEPTAAETALRAIGFRSAKRAATQDEQYESRSEIKRYSDRKTKIYEEYRAAKLSRNLKKMQAVQNEIQKFNRTLIKQKMVKFVPLITKKSLKTQAKRLSKPNKQIRVLTQRS
jgi:ribosomal protein L24